MYGHGGISGYYRFEVHVRADESTCSWDPAGCDYAACQHADVEASSSNYVSVKLRGDDVFDGVHGGEEEGCLGFCCCVSYW